MYLEDVLLEKTLSPGLPDLPWRAPSLGTVLSACLYSVEVRSGFKDERFGRSWG